MELYLPILYGSVREGRKSFAVAEFIESRLQIRPGVTTKLFDPRNLPFGNLVRREWEMDPASPEVQAFVQEMARADGFVVVTPEYNFGIPGALKNMFDHLFDEWNHKPFGLVTAGGIAGGARAGDQLRIGIPGLRDFTIPMSLPVPSVERTFGPSGSIADRPDWEKRVDAFLAQLEWYARALSEARRTSPPV